MRSHLTGMAVAAVLVLAVLLAAGVRPGAALPWAATLACPLMMIAMMVMMRRGHAQHREQPRTPPVEEPANR